MMNLVEIYKNIKYKILLLFSNIGLLFDVIALIYNLGTYIESLNQPCYMIFVFEFPLGNYLMEPPTYKVREGLKIHIWIKI